MNISNTVTNRSNCSDCYINMLLYYYTLYEIHTVKPTNTLVLELYFLYEKYIFLTLVHLLVLLYDLVINLLAPELFF